MFKGDWEKASALHTLSQDTVEQMVRFAYPDKKLLSWEVIAGGCANLNIKILLEGDASPMLLRIYLRDPSSAYREQKLAELLKQTIPIPTTYYVGTIAGHQFALTEYMYGISLRELLLSDAQYDMNAVMQEMGIILSKIRAYEFPQAGFFDQDLRLIPHTSADSCKDFALGCLEDKTVRSVITPDLCSKIRLCLEQYAPLFPDGRERNLVHGDFDPSNILVTKDDGVWKVSAILDWEFAFSGSVLWDMANMLRYAHKMPPEFQSAFLKGLALGGVSLPESWGVTLNLLNLSALLDCLKRADPKTQPKRCADISELIHDILTNFKENPLRV